MNLDILLCNYYVGIYFIDSANGKWLKPHLVKIYSLVEVLRRNVCCRDTKGDSFGSLVNTVFVACILCRATSMKV